MIPVSRVGKDNVIINSPPLGAISKREALELAVWLVFYSSGNFEEFENMYADLVQEHLYGHKDGG